MSAPNGSVASATVHVRLLGPPAIERDGSPVAVDTRKAVALLAYLAVTRRRQSRDHLAALLWPEADQTHARSALRRTLSALNSALGGAGMHIGRESLEYTGDGVTADVQAFVDASSGDEPHAWSRAVDLYGGEFLSGFALRDSPDFDEWQLAAADEFRRMFGTVLERLSEAFLGSDPDAAITFAKRWVNADALHEPAHRALMRAYERKGDRGAALRQYRECVATLERELGVEPLEETTELYESIRESRPARRRPTEVRTTKASSDLPLVGREQELRAVESAYGSIGPDGHLIVIGGEPGIGKTRLATEFLASVRARGGLVLEARCHPEEDGLAFGTAVELLRSIPSDRLETIAQETLAEVARLVPSVAPRSGQPAELDSPAARRRLFEAIADTLTAACGAEPAGFVVVDDVQWTDDSSLDVLRFLVRRLRGRPIGVVLTWRTEEVPPAHPLRRTLADASRLRLATPITLQRLSEDEVRALAGAVDVRDDVAETLYAETAGVPFFVVEYLRSAEIGDGSRDRLPAGVRDLLASRVGNVSGGAAQVLAAAAVIGRAFEPPTVRETSGRSEEEVAAALEELAGAGLVAEDVDRYDFTHPKLRMYVYEDTTLVRRRLLHGRAAKAFARRARRHPELAALAALHFERSGDEASAAEHYERAGDHARAVYANAEALAHYRSALALGHGDATPLHEAIGDLLTLDGRYPEAIASYEKAAALGAELGVVARKLGGVHHRLGDWDAAEAHYLEATEALGTGPGLARVLADRSRNAHRADRHDLAVELIDAALERASEEDDARAKAFAHNVAGILASHRRDFGAARAHLQASLDLSEGSNDPAATAAALNNLALALRADGDAAAALTENDRALELCRRVGDRHREAAVLSNMADLLRDLGHDEEAKARVRQSAEILTEIGELDDPHPEIWKLVEW